MNMDRVAIKARARALMQSTEPRPLWIGAVYLAASWVINLAYQKLGNGMITLDGVPVESMAFVQQALLDPESVNASLMFQPKTGGSLLMMLLSLAMAVIYAGFQIYSLRVVRGEKAGYGDLLAGFEIVLRVVWLNILRSMLLLLWTCLFIIPGIVAAYRYRQAFYLLVDHPDWGAWRCLRESSRMMRGHKAELFVLDLSFLGWELLCILQIVRIYVDPYIELTQAEYYCRLTGEVRQEPRPGDGWQNPGEKPPWEY